MKRGTGRTTDGGIPSHDELVIVEVGNGGDVQEDPELELRGRGRGEEAEEEVGQHTERATEFFLRLFGADERKGGRKFVKDLGLRDHVSRGPGRVGNEERT